MTQDYAFGAVTVGSGGSDMLGDQVATGEVAVLRQGSIPANVVGLAQVGGGDYVSELVSGVGKDDPMGSLASPGAACPPQSCER